MADESLPTPTPVKDHSSTNPTPLLAKVTQVILSVFIIGLVVDPLNSFHRILNRPHLKLDDVAIIYVAVAGYMLINMIFIIGYAMGDRMPKRTSIMFSAIGSLLHIVAGSVMVHNWRKRMNAFIDFQNNAIHTSKQYNDMLISASVFTFLNAAVFAVDIFLTMSHWDTSQGAPMMVPPPGIGHGCAIPSNMACDDPSTLPMAKPIRVFQFLLVTVLFSMTIYTISNDSPYQPIEAILLTVLFGSFLFIELVDIISQCGGDPIPDTPMFLFGVVGTLLFLIAAGGIFFVTRRDGIVQIWRLTVSMALAAASSLLFILDVLLIFLYGY